MAYGIPNITAMTDIVSIPNSTTNGLFAVLFLAGIFLGVLVIASRGGFDKAFVGASFMTAIAAAYFGIMGFIPVAFTAVPVVLFFISLLLIKGNREVL